MGVKANLTDAQKAALDARMAGRRDPLGDKTYVLSAGQVATKSGHHRIKVGRTTLTMEERIATTPWPVPLTALSVNYGPGVETREKRLKAELTEAGYLAGDFSTEWFDVPLQVLIDIVTRPGWRPPQKDNDA